MVPADLDVCGQEGGCSTRDSAVGRLDAMDWQRVEKKK